MSGAELCGKSSGDRGTQRVGLSLCPLSQSADLRPCVYRGPKKPDFPGDARGEELTCQRRRHKGCEFEPWVKKIPWRRAWQPIPMFLPGESHEQRSLVGYCPQGHKKSDKTEMT